MSDDEPTSKTMFRVTLKSRADAEYPGNWREWPLYALRPMIAQMDRLHMDDGQELCDDFRSYIEGTGAARRFVLESPR